MTNDIILLATYWNEREWVKPSLEQIDQINPLEAIICDGCFDPDYPLHSTDGTREIIRQFVDDRENMKMVSPQRTSRLKAVSNCLAGYDYQNNIFRGNIKAALKFAKDHTYRRNQAATFNHMIEISESWEPDRWFMTYDCDQFYPKEVINKFSICNQDTRFGVLFANELTFLDSFQTCTPDYEKRMYNNMPHKIYSDTLIQPTRDIIRGDGERDSLFDGFWSDLLYKNQVEHKHIGRYHHYKLRPGKLSKRTYELGDRVEPDWDEYQKIEYGGDHPEMIKKYFEL